MTRYVFAFHGGATPSSAEESERLIAAWANWMQGLGSALIDPGSPTNAWKTVMADGSTSHDGGPNPVTGYTIVEAESLDAAVALTSGNPIFNAGGSIEVLEMSEM